MKKLIAAGAAVAVVGTGALAYRVTHRAVEKPVGTPAGLVTQPDSFTELVEYNRPSSVNTVETAYRDYPVRLADYAWANSLSYYISFLAEVTAP